MTEYLFPATPEEAVRCLIERGGHALIIAGGTDVLPDLAKGKRAPTCLVDITRIATLREIAVSAADVTIGSAVSFLALREHSALARRVPALAEAAESVGARPIQAAATWVGNLVQAMPAADGAIIAVALDAEARVLDANGASWRAVADLYEGPGRSAIDPTRQLVTHIRFRAPPQGWGSAWRRTGRRPSLVLPTLNCAATITLEGQTVAAATIALGPVGACPVRARAAEDFLVGRAADAATFAEAARLALCNAHPRSSALRGSREYRLTILPALVEETLKMAAQRARQQIGA